MTDKRKGTIRHDDGSLEMFIEGADGQVLHLTFIPEEEAPGCWMSAEGARSAGEAEDWVRPPERTQCGYGLAWEAQMRAEREGDDALAGLQ